MTAQIRIIKLHHEQETVIALQGREIDDEGEVAAEGSALFDDTPECLQGVFFAFLVAKNTKRKNTALKWVPARVLNGLYAGATEEVVHDWVDLRYIPEEEFTEELFNSFEGEADKLVAEYQATQATIH